MQTDTLQFISARCEQISLKFYKGWTVAQGPTFRLWW